MLSANMSTDCFLEAGGLNGIMYIDHITISTHSSTQKIVWILNLQDLAIFVLQSHNATGLQIK